jgi:hypothetical protein
MAASYLPIIRPCEHRRSGSITYQNGSSTSSAEVATPSEECVSAFQRYIYGGIASFAEGVQRATVVALQNSRHNLHLESPDELKAVKRRWIANLTMRR